MPFHKHLQTVLGQENLRILVFFRLFQHQSSVCACHCRRELEHYTLSPNCSRALRLTRCSSYLRKCATIVLNACSKYHYSPGNKTEHLSHTQGTGKKQGLTPVTGYHHRRPPMPAEIRP